MSFGFWVAFAGFARASEADDDVVGASTIDDGVVTLLLLVLLVVSICIEQSGPVQPASQ